MPDQKNAVGVPFSIHVQGDVTGKLWHGEFRAKEKLSFRDRLNTDRLRRELVGEAPGPVDPGVAIWASVISQLSVRLTEAPEWWTSSKGGLDLEDENVLETVFREAMRVEGEYFKRLGIEAEAVKVELRKEEK